MSNKAAFRKGQRVVRNLPCISATVLAIGDMCFYDTDDVKPASAFTWNTNIATTQAGFADVFLGIAMHKSASGDTVNVDVDISVDSVYSYDMTSDTYEFGAPVGPAKDTGDALLSGQLVDAVAASSVARVVERLATAGTKAMVSFAAAFNPSANVAATVLG